jgi:hypothetical protein
MICASINLHVDRGFVALHIDNYRKAVGTVNEEVAKLSATLLAYVTEDCLESPQIYLERIEAIRNNGFESNEKISEALAFATYNTVLKEPSFENRQALLNRVENLRQDFSENEEIAKSLANIIYETSLLETNAERSLASALKIESIHSDFESNETITVASAKALEHAATLNPTTEVLTDISSRIQVLMDETVYEDEDLILTASRFFYFVTEHVTDPERFLTLYERIVTMRANGFEDNEEIALLLIKALTLTCGMSKDVTLRQDIVNRIESIRYEFEDHKEMTLLLAKSIFEVTELHPAPEISLQAAERIKALSGSESTLDYYLLEYGALINALDVESPSEIRETIVGKLRSFKQRSMLSLTV